MTELAELTWAEANQARLLAEFARLKRLLSRSEQASEVTAEASSPDVAIDRVTSAFDLTPFERDLLLLIAGVEMDSELAALCASAGSRPHASFGLALSVLPEPHWSALTPLRPLRRFRLLEPKDEQAIASSRLCIDERILHYLAGVNYLEPRLSPIVTLVGEPSAFAPGHRAVARTIVDALEARDGRIPLIGLTGDDRSGQRDVAWVVSDALGLRLHVARSRDLPAAPHELDAFARLWQREAALLDSALLVDCEPESAATGALLAERLRGVVFVAAREPVASSRATRQFSVSKPNAGDQKALWLDALGPAASALNGALDAVASQFRFSAETIARTGEALSRTLSEDPEPDRALWRACRVAARTTLDDLAQRIEPNAGWDDLIIPAAQKSLLRQIVAHVRGRNTVYETWGFSGKGARGLGISALFAGESGTGKTMAAEILAGELRLDLYRIDLSSTVSKYIGETEKNLRRLFDAAERSGAILLFDEADALFGKRSEVKDSHDRYANIEVSYLLQRMEAYRGLAVLTTNSKTALDPAFQRRLRFVVQFPFPDQSQRERIWRGIFPAATPLDGIDPAKLARLNVAGGSIRNIALNAAFLAAESGEPVRMTHLLAAAHGEASKRERPFSEAEVRGWA